jgi:hypothetical protein
MIKPAALSLVLAAALLTGCGASASPAAVASPTAPPPCPVATDASLASMTDEQLVRKLLEVMGADKLGKQVADAMMDTFKKMPQLPPGFIERFKQNMKIETLNDIVVRVYLKHLDRTAITAAIQFYESEQGKRIVAALPVVTQETMEAGKEWGRDLAQKTMQELGAGK